MNGVWYYLLMKLPIPLNVVIDDCKNSKPPLLHWEKLRSLRSFDGDFLSFHAPSGKKQQKLRVLWHPFPILPCMHMHMHMHPLNLFTFLCLFGNFKYPMFIALKNLCISCPYDIMMPDTTIKFNTFFWASI